MTADLNYRDKMDRFVRSGKDVNLAPQEDRERKIQMIKITWVFWLYELKI